MPEDKPGFRSSTDFSLRPGYYVLMTDGGIAAEKGGASGPAAIGVLLKDLSTATSMRCRRRSGGRGTITWLSTEP